MAEQKPNLFRATGWHKKNDAPRYYRKHVKGGTWEVRRYAGRGTYSLYWTTVRLLQWDAHAVTGFVLKGTFESPEAVIAFVALSSNAS
jgi:hypothetical protein